MVDPRPRRLGRLSQQVKAYLADAPQAVVDEVIWVLDCFERGEQECWDRLPQSQSPSRPGRMALLMSNGHVLVWQPYRDYPDLYAILYVGPAGQFS